MSARRERWRPLLWMALVALLATLGGGVQAAPAAGPPAQPTPEPTAPSTPPPPAPQATPEATAPPAPAPPTPGATAPPTPPTAGPSARPSDLGVLAYLAQGDIWIAREDGSERSQLTRGGIVDWFAWSPRGTELLLSTRAPAAGAGRPEGEAVGGLFVVGLDGAPPRRLDTVARTAGTPRRGAWAPSGAQVAFVDGDAVIVVDRQGTEASRIAISLPRASITDLAAPGLYLGTPAFYPDGRSLLIPAATRFETGVAGNTRGRFYALTLADAALTPVGAHLPVLGGHLPDNTSFAPGGQAFGYLTLAHRSACEEYGYFTRIQASGDSILAIDPQPGPPPTLRLASPPQPVGAPNWGFYPRGYSWAPDGGRVALAFAFQECTSAAGSPPPAQAHVFVAAFGGEVQPIGRGTDPAWSPRGDRLAYASDESPATIRVRDLASGRERDIAAGTQPAWQPPPSGP